MSERNGTELQESGTLPGFDSRTSAIAQVASAYAAKDTSTVADILELVDGLSRAFFTVEAAARARLAHTPAIQPVAARAVPAVPIEQAVQQDKVTCLCCGGSFTMLKRHLKAEHGLTEDEYRAKFGLPEEFPLVAPAYSARKADYARKAGLGKHSREPSARSTN